MVMRQDMFFKLILESGHVGAGKSYEMVRYLQGRDIFSVLFSASHFPRVKKKGSRKGIKLIQEITRREYLQGRMREREDPYLNTHKGKAKRTSRNVTPPLALRRISQRTVRANRMQTMSMRSCCNMNTPELHEKVQESEG